jgi:hypothetical protein
VSGTDDTGPTWYGWALIDGSWCLMAEAGDLGTAHRLLLAATAGMGLSSSERYLILGSQPPAPQSRESTRTVETTP